MTHLSPWPEGLVSSWQISGTDWIGDLQIGPLIGGPSWELIFKICSVRVSTLTCRARLWILCLQWSSWLLVDAGLPMRCFSPCTTTIASLPYLKESGTLSSLFCLCMLLWSCCLFSEELICLISPWAKVWTASVAASSSRQLMWIVCSWGDQGPLVDFPLQVALQWSVWVYYYYWSWRNKASPIPGGEVLFPPLQVFHCLRGQFD